MAIWYGPSFPFYRGRTLLGSTSKILPRQEDSRLIKNDFIQGILTNLGERPFRPGFGGDVTNFVFDQNDINSRNAIEDSIRTHAETFHPRILIASIDVVQPDDNPNVMSVNIFGRTKLDATNVNELLVNFMVPVSGTIGPNSQVNPLEPR